MKYKTYEIEFRIKANDIGYSEVNILKCLRYAEHLFNNNLPIIYNSSHLAYLVDYKKSYIKRVTYSQKSFYRKFKIRKSNNKNREISEPLPSLKDIQNWILINILYKIKVSKFAKAYIPKKTIRENVRFHKGQEKVICVDIKNFFSSITECDVTKIFTKMGYSSRVAFVLAKLCCLDGCLPQGAPTSPHISNIYLLSLDKLLADYCIPKKIRYTRYADDMTFSGSFNEGELFCLLNTELDRIGLVLNSDKTNVMTRNMRQVVTGIVVNDKIQVPIEKRKELRQAIYYIEKFGLVSHLKKINCSKANYLKHLLGIVNYVVFINPKDMEAKLQKDFLVSLIKDRVIPKVYKK